MSFYNTLLEEQETLINIDYSRNELIIYTSQKMVYQRLKKKLGQPYKVGYIKNKIVSGIWTISFDDKMTITKILSRPTLVGD